MNRRRFVCRSVRISPLLLAVALGIVHPLSSSAQQSWGYNFYGELGVLTNTGTSTANPVPVTIGGISAVTSLAAGTYHTLALKGDGTVWAWGYNSYGALGNTTNSGTGKANPTPTQVAGLSNVKAISAGYHSLALGNDGSVWAWGDNQFGQLGNTTNISTAHANPTPALVGGVSGVAAIAAGWYHTLALKTDGTVWAWGFNYYGQLGNDTNTSSNSPNATPAQVSGLPAIVAIAAGQYHSLALAADGTVWAWGWNRYGQLGDNADNNTDNPISTPHQIGGLSNVTSIAAGAYHSLALTADNTVWGWGYNFNGQLGNAINISTVNANPAPTQIPTFAAVTAIAAGDFHSLALKTDGTVWTWGFNLYGQLGNGAHTGTPAPTPVQVTGLSGVLAIAGGAGDSFAIPPVTVAVTIASAMTGSTFSVTGAGCQAGNYAAPQVLQWLPGSACSVSFTSPQSGTPGTQYTFAAWADGSLNNPRTIATPASPTTYTAQFQTQYLLTSASSPVSGGFVTGGGYYNANAAQSIAATANPGYNFSTWTGPVAAAGSASTSVQMTGPVSVTANFVVAATAVTIASSVPGLSFTVSGTGCQPGSYPAPTTLSWTTGSSCAVSFTSPQAGAAGTQYVFSAWGDTLSANPRTFAVPASATTYTADFQTQYLLTVAASPSGAGSVTGGGYYNAGSNAPVTATASSGFAFLNWTGAVASASSASTTVSMTAPLSITATFSEFTTIASSPAGLSFSVTGAGCQAGSYSTPQVLSWVPGSSCNVSFGSQQAGTVGTQYLFTGWADGPSANPRTFVASSSAVAYTANFQRQYLLATSVAVGGIQAGSISPGGYYNEGLAVSVSAAANPGYQFTGFSGDLAGLPASQSITMNGPHSVAANFAMITSVTVAAAAGQYSDPVSLSATLLPANLAVSGSMQFAVGGVPVGSVPASGSGTYTLPYVIKQKQGMYAVTAVFSSSTVGILGSGGSNTLTASWEDAVVTPSAANPAAVMVSAPGGAASFTLTATMQELPDGNAGDIANANPVTFTLNPAIAAAPISCSPAASAVKTATTPNTLTVTCTFTNVPVNVYDVAITIGGDYYAGAAKSAVAVYDPSLGFVTGNARILHNNIAGSFSVNAQYKNDGSLQGDFSYSEQGSGGLVTVNATNLQSLSVVGNTVVLVAPVTVNGGGNYMARAFFFNNGNSGKDDAFGLQVTDVNGNIVPDLTFAPASLTGGNLQIH